MISSCESHAKYIKNICLSNFCSQKLLCDSCLSQPNNQHNQHKMLPFNTFMKYLEQYCKSGQTIIQDEGILSAVHGEYIEDKEKNYQKIAEDAKDNLKNTFINQLNDSYDKLINGLVENIRKCKKVQNEFLLKKLDLQFSSYTLHNKIATIKGVEKVIDMLQGMKYLSNIQVNDILVSLHLGKLELQYEEQTLQKIVQKFQEDIDFLSENLLNQVNKETQKFYKYVAQLNAQIEDEEPDIQSLPRNQLNFRIKEIDFTKMSRIFSNVKSNQQQLTKQNSLNFTHHFQNLKLEKLSHREQTQILQSLDFTHRLAPQYSHKIVKTEHSQANVQNLQTTQNNTQRISLSCSTLSCRFALSSSIQTQNEILAICAINNNTLLVSSANNLLQVYNVLSKQIIHTTKTLTPISQFVIGITPGLILSLGHLKQQTRVIIWLYSDQNNFVQISEFRDLQKNQITTLEFISEKWQKNCYDLSKKYSNEIIFLTYAPHENIKIWLYCFNTGKANIGDIKTIQEIEIKYNIERIAFMQESIYAFDKIQVFKWQLTENYHKVTNVQMKKLFFNGKDAITCVTKSQNEIIVGSQNGNLIIISNVKIIKNLKNNDFLDIHEEQISLNKFTKQSSSLSIQNICYILNNIVCFAQCDGQDWVFCITQNLQECLHKQAIEEKGKMVSELFQSNNHGCVVTVEGNIINLYSYNAT